MADFQPFAGLRYDPARVNLSHVICPPYDVIKGHRRDDLLKRDKHNFVAVELAARYGENAAPRDYERSAHTLQQWQDESVLVRDDRSFYVYEQEFTVPGTGETKKRRGVLGALQLEPFGKGVQPHEHTLSGPKQDRLNLLRAVRANTSPIFGLYTDDTGWADRLIEDVCFSAPVGEATDEDGVIHRVWRVLDEEMQNGLVAALQDESILIADGHHRYETALNYLEECKAQAEADGKTWTGDEDENYVMMMLVALDDAGLIVLPTHRVVLGVTYDDVSRLENDLAPLFDITLVPTEPGDAQQAKALTALLDAPSEEPKLGMHIQGQSYLLTLRPGSAHRLHLDQGRSDAYNSLDVTLLHDLILNKELGIDAAALAGGGRVSYTIDAADAIATVNAGKAGAAFILRSTPVQAVQDVAQGGDKMPQKSTYFYPKLATGLVLRPLK